MDEGEDQSTIGATQMELNVSTQDMQSVFPDEVSADEEAVGEKEVRDDSSDDKPLGTAEPPVAAAVPALFGDEEEEDEEEEEEESPEPEPREELSPGIRHSNTSGDPRRPVAPRPHPQEYEAMAEDAVDDDIVRIPLNSSKGQPNATDKLTLVGLPSSVRLDPEIFNVERYREYEKKLVSNQKVNELRDLQKELTGEVIRTKLKEPGAATEELDPSKIPIDKLRSTCKYVEFSDGTSAVLIGQNVYSQIGISDFNAVLLDVSQVPVLRAQGDLTSRRIYSIATRKFMP